MDGATNEPTDGLELLRSACQRMLDAGEPNSRIDGKTASELAVDVVRELDAYREAWTERRTAAAGFTETRWRQRLLLLDLTPVVCFDLLRLLDRREQHGKPDLWQKATPTGESFPHHHQFRHALTGLANHSLSLRHLVGHGFDLPARVVFRAYTELGDTVVAYLVDRRFFDHYRSCTGAPGEDYFTWKKHLAPKQARRVIDQFTTRTGLDHATAADMARRRIERYSWLSGFEHAHPVALFATAYATMEDSDHASSALGGSPSTGSRAILEAINNYDFEFFSLLFAALGSHHGWTMPSDLEEGIAAMFHWRMLRSLSLKLDEHDERPESGTT